MYILYEQSTFTNFFAFIYNCDIDLLTLYYICTYDYLLLL